ncbi:MAG: hypothetical protein A2Y20_06175 [Firmicutes bacterium GWF2_51_9]|nr:MAG: hypothetical protein A2Y20_06175 [Firmicutes bacterium GWF2_51_9]OGS58009.1 MAG: hypothetical protein A2Y19_05575 [Firmicutes bacterium GWE2_51_13]HAM64003.1 hypothetical protein [Erysipelotrichaceae bacterium]HBZ42432.1 hypothetical protein [Erysipelotrichaceae bacterium]
MQTKTQSIAVSRISILLKCGVVLSSIGAIFFQMFEPNYKGLLPILKAFTIQSNLWIGITCLVFLILILKWKDESKIPQWLYHVKFMFTVDILLTYLVFAVLLSPLMSLRFLTSTANFFQHNLTSILALLDFLITDPKFVSKGKHVWLSLLPTLAYAIYFFTSYAITGIMPVAYFFLDYKKLGWFTIGDAGIGVGIWTLLLCGLLLIIGVFVLKLKKLFDKNPKWTGVAVIATMLVLSLFFVIQKMISV